MSKKLYAAFLPLLAVAAFAVLPAAAQAQVPHWYSCQAKAGGTYENSVCTKTGAGKLFEWVKTAEGVPVVVKTTGSPTLTLHALGAEITCKVLDYGVIENPVGGGVGIDLITEFVNSGCVSTPTTACPAAEIIVFHAGKPLSLLNALPTKLLVGPPIRDEITEIEVEVRCSGAKVDLFSGTLTPEIGSSVAVFGAGSGELEDPAKNKATVTGTDDLEGPAGDLGITAKTP